jgi:hypothetical protein
LRDVKLPVNSSKNVPQLSSGPRQVGYPVRRRRHRLHRRLLQGFLLGAVPADVGADAGLGGGAGGEQQRRPPEGGGGRRPLRLLHGVPQHRVPDRAQLPAHPGRIFDVIVFVCMNFLSVKSEKFHVKCMKK